MLGWSRETFQRLVGYTGESAGSNEGRWRWPISRNQKTGESKKKMTQTNEFGDHRKFGSPSWDWRPENPPHQHSRILQVMKHARPSKEVAGAKAIISECQKKNGGFVGRERYGLLVLGFVFRKRIATEACNESLGQPHGQHSPGAQVSPEKNCARCSHYKPWTWPPLKPWRPKITLLKKWEVVKGFPWRDIVGIIYSFSLGGIFWVGDMFRKKVPVCHQRFGVVFFVFQSMFG